MRNRQPVAWHRHLKDGGRLFPKKNHSHWLADSWGTQSPTLASFSPCGKQKTCNEHSRDRTLATATTMHKIIRSIFEDFCQVYAYTPVHLCKHIHLTCYDHRKDTDLKMTLGSNVSLQFKVLSSCSILFIHPALVETFIIFAHSCLWYLLCFPFLASIYWARY